MNYLCEYGIIILIINVLIQSENSVDSNSEANVIWAQRFGTWSIFRSLIGKPNAINRNSTRFSYSDPQRESQYGSLCYNPRADTIYWTDQSQNGLIMTQNRLKSFDWPTNIPTILKTSIDIKDFTVDWTTNNVYLIDSRGAISVLTESKGELLTNVIHSLDVEDPISITCDVMEGYLFWTDSSLNHPRIESSILNGHQRRILIETPLVSFPSSITILKHGGSKLFWTDEKTHQILSSDYEGNNFRVLFNFAENGVPRGLAAFEEYIFMTDTSSLSVEIFWENGQNRINLDALPYDIITVTPDSPDFEHECDELKCDRFCFNIGMHKGECGCDGADEGGLCQGIQLIMSTPEKVFLASVDVSINNLNASLSITTHEKLNATFIDFEYKSKILVWGDHCSGSIFNMQEVGHSGYFLELGNIWEITAQQSSIEGVTINWIDSIIMWIDSSVHHIMGSSFDGSYHSIYLNKLNQPRSLVVDALHGTIYWSQINNNMRREIAIFSYHGDRNIRKLIELDHQDIGDLVIDVTLKRLYWSDPFSNKLYCFHIDNNVRDTFDTNINYLNKFTVFKDMIISTHPLDLQAYKQPIIILDKRNNSYFQTKIELNRFSIDDVNIGNTTGDVVVYGSYLQPMKSSVCSRNNSCQQICLSVDDSCVCKCAIGFSEDGDKCYTKILNGPSIYFVDTYHKQIYQISPLSSLSASSSTTNFGYDGVININLTFGLPHPPLTRPSQFVVNGDEGLVYILDVGMIKVYDATYKEIEIIYPTNQNKGVHVFNITQIALDKLENCLYMTDNNNKIILKFDLKNKNIIIWKEQLMNLFAIAVDSSRRFLYWSEGGQLKSSSLNDPNNVTNHIILKNISSIDIRSEENVIYVSDFDDGSIILYNKTDGRISEILKNKYWRLWKVVSDDDFVYLVCFNQRGVYRISRWNDSNKVQLMTAPIFSRIVDIAFVPIFVQKDEFSRIPIIVGTLLALFLLLLLLLLLFCLLKRKNKQVSPEVNPILNSNETNELVGISNENMFYPRLNTISIIPVEWENIGMNIHDVIHTNGEEMTDNYIVVPHDDLLLNGMPTSEDSRYLLTIQTKIPFIKIPTAELNPAMGGDYISNENEEREPKPNKRDTYVGNKIDPSDIVSESGPDDQPFTLIGLKRGKETPAAGQLVLIPPKLHDQPRGFAPASHSVPAAIRNTFGRIKNSNKLNLADNSKC